MPQFDQERVELARAVQNDLAQERTLSPLQARSFVRCIQTTWEVEVIRWTGDDFSPVLQQARNLIRAGKVLLTVEGGSPTEAAFAFRRAGELLEWLARAKDTVGSEIPTALFAAGCYQLGGLPAMASGLLRQVVPDDRGSRLLADFLRPTLTEYFVALGICGILIGLSPAGGRTAILWGRHLRERRLVQHSRIGSVYWPCIAKLAAGRFRKISSGYRAPERCRAALVENNFRRRCVACFFSVFSLRKVRRSDDLSTVETTRPPQSGAAFRCQYVCKEAVREGPGHPLAIPEARHRKATK